MHTRFGDTDGVPSRILMMYWGRRGAMGRFLLEAAAAARELPSLKPLLSASRSGELIGQIRSCGLPLFEVTTFHSGLGALLQIWRIIGLRRRLSRFVQQHQVDALVVLMSHVWTPLIAASIKRAGIPYIVVVHDAKPHPGDRSGRVLRWLLRDLQFADRIVALTRTVADTLVETGRASPDRITVLFHPEFHVKKKHEAERAEPLRVLFLGRIAAYKGLPLFVRALELLRDRGLTLESSVAGEGNLKPYRARLLDCGTHVINRWLNDDEIDDILAVHDIVVLTHTEASQSGVAALALGAGLPIVATPVGGLREQIEHGVNGLLAERVDAAAIADSLGQLLAEPELLASLREGVLRTRSKRSMNRFVQEIVKVCADVGGKQKGKRESRSLDQSNSIRQQSARD